MEKISSLFESLPNLDVDENVIKLKTKILSYKQPKQIDSKIYSILEDIVPILFSPNKNIRLLAIKLIQLITYPKCDYGRGNHVALLQKHLNEDLNSLFYAAIDEEDEEWCLFWCCIVRLFGIQLHQFPAHTINSLLRIVEKGFKSPSNSNRQLAFLCWTELIWNFSLNMNELCTKKRLDLILIPLMAKNCKTEEIAIAKFEAWWLLLNQLQPRLESFLKQVLEPFFNFYFGPFSSDDNKMSAAQLHQYSGRNYESVSNLAANALLELFGHKNECLCEKKSSTPLLASTIFPLMNKKLLEVLVTVTKRFVVLKQIRVIPCLWYRYFHPFALSESLDLIDVQEFYAGIVKLFVEIDDDNFALIISCILEQLTEYTFLMEPPKLKLFFHLWKRSEPFKRCLELDDVQNGYKQLFQALFKQETTTEKIAFLDSLELTTFDLSSGHDDIFFWYFILEHFYIKDWLINSPRLYEFAMLPLNALARTPIALINELGWTMYYKVVSQRLDNLLFYNPKSDQTLNFLLTSISIENQIFQQEKFTLIIQNLANSYIKSLPKDTSWSEKDLETIKKLILFCLKLKDCSLMIGKLFDYFSKDIIVSYLNDNDFINSLKNVSINVHLKPHQQHLEVFPHLIRSASSINHFIGLKTVLDQWTQVLNTVTLKSTHKVENLFQFIENCNKTYTNLFKNSPHFNPNHALDIQSVLNTDSSVPSRDKSNEPVSNGANWIFNTNLLSEKQKERIKKRGSDIPALYEDNTQSNSEDMFDSQKIKKIVHINKQISDQSNSENVQLPSNDKTNEKSSELSINENEIAKTPLQVNVNSLASQKIIRELKKIKINTNEYVTLPALIPITETPTNTRNLRRKSIKSVTIVSKSPRRQSLENKYKKNEINIVNNTDSNAISTKNSSPEKSTTNKRSPKKNKKQSGTDSNESKPRLLLKLSRKKDSSFESSKVIDPVPSTENVISPDSGKKATKRSPPVKAKNDLVKKKSENLVVSPKATSSKLMDVTLTPPKFNESLNIVNDFVNNLEILEVTTLQEQPLVATKKIPTDEEMMLNDLASKDIAPVSVRPASLDLQDTQPVMENFFQDTQPVTDSILNEVEIDDKNDTDYLKNDNEVLDNSILMTSLMNSPPRDNNADELMAEFLNKTSEISPIKSDPKTTTETPTTTVDPLEISPNLQKKVTYISNQPPELINEESDKEEVEKTSQNTVLNSIKIRKPIRIRNRSARLLELVPGAKSVIAIETITNQKRKLFRPRKKIFAARSLRGAQLLARSLKISGESLRSGASKENEEKELEVLTFEKALPSPLAVPSSSIIKSAKRKCPESTDDCESPLGHVSKRKRVSFLDPPVSCEKQYVPEEIPRRTWKKKRFLGTNIDNDDNENVNTLDGMKENGSEIEEDVLNEIKDEIVDNDILQSTTEYNTFVNKELPRIESFIIEKTSPCTSSSENFTLSPESNKSNLFTRIGGVIDLTNDPSISRTNIPKTTQTDEHELSTSSIQLDKSHTSLADMIIQQFQNQDEMHEFLRDFVKLVGKDLAFEILYDELEFRHLIKYKNFNSRLLEAMKYSGFTVSTETYINYALSTVGEERAAKQFYAQLEKYPKTIATLKSLTENYKSVESPQTNLLKNKHELTKALAEFSSDDILEIFSNAVHLKRS